MINKTKTLTKIGIIALIVTTASVAKAKNVALLIGVSDYKSKKIEDLEGPKHDVAALNQALIKNWAFKPENITTLIDSQASQQGILNALNALEQQTTAGDEILIYFSGHGTSIYDEDGGGNAYKDALSSNTGAFAPYDYNVQDIERSIAQGDVIGAIINNLITGQYHLKPIIKQLEKDRFVTGIMDACFSEHSFRSIGDKGELPNRSIPSNKLAFPKFNQPLSLKTSRFDDDKYPYSNVITISASSKAQPAKDINDEFLNIHPNTTFDAKPHGLLSDLLLRILNGHIDAGGRDGIISYSDLESAVKSNIINYPIKKEKLQTPFFQPLLANSSSTNVMNRPLFGLNKSLVRQIQLNPKLKFKIENLEAFKQVVDNSLFVPTNSGLVDFRVLGKSNQWQLSTGNGTPILSNGTDYQLKNRINTAYWLRSHLSSSADKTHMRVNTLPEAAGNVFKEGEQVQFAVSFDKPSALLAFNITSQGDINILYPINSIENKTLAANQLKTLPEDEKINIQAPFGLDQVVFVTLSQPLNDIELNTLSKLISGSNSTLITPEIKVLSNIIKNKATAIRQLKIQTHAK